MKWCLHKTIIFLCCAWYAEISAFLYHYNMLSRGMLSDHISARNTQVHTCKQAQIHPQRQSSFQLIWMETESQNKMEEL